MNRFRVSFKHIALLGLVVFLLVGGCIPFIGNDNGRRGHSHTLADHHHYSAERYARCGADGTAG